MIAAGRPALACFAAAAAWPLAMTWLSRVTASPLERAMREAWCGAPQHGWAELLGYCAACWGGAAFLVATGLWLLSRRRQSVRLRV